MCTDTHYLSGSVYSVKIFTEKIFIEAVKFENYISYLFYYIYYFNKISVIKKFKFNQNKILKFLRWKLHALFYCKLMYL